MVLKKKIYTQNKKSNFFFQFILRIIKLKKGEVMRNSKTHSVTLKKKLEKSQSTFIAYNELQYALGNKLDSNPNIVEIKFNVKLKGCPEGEHYTTDFCCTKTNGELMVRECVYKNKLLKPMTVKLLDISRNYWHSRGVKDWGIVIDDTQ